MVSVNLIAIIPDITKTFVSCQEAVFYMLECSKDDYISIWMKESRATLACSQRTPGDFYVLQFHQLKGLTCTPRGKISFAA